MLFPLYGSDEVSETSDDFCRGLRSYFQGTQGYTVPISIFCYQIVGDSQGTHNMQ